MSTSPQPTSSRIVGTLNSVSVFKPDQATLDVQKITFAIWRFRQDANFVNDLTEVLSKFVDEKRVFNEIEFYLPQLAHMIIHLDVDWTNQSLERFAVMICQTSLHATFQLTFILVAALEDYQPELSNGRRNPNCNITLFTRCARLLQNVQRAIVYGSATLSRSEEELLNRTVEFEKFDRAYQITRSNNTVGTGKASEGALPSRPAIAGHLLYKRNVRKSVFQAKSWKVRFFRIDQRVLYCYYNETNPNPIRAIPLEGCDLQAVTNGKYQFQMLLEQPSTNTQFKLRSTDQASFDTWFNTLNREITRPPDGLPPSTPSEDSSTVPTTNSSSTKRLLDQTSLASEEQGMTTEQRVRFRLFHQQRRFITQMTDLCERLRFLDRDVRKFFLKRDLASMVIPPYFYLPLTTSIETYSCVLRSLPSECHAFSTKARCPALMMFEVQDAPSGADVASFFCEEIANYPLEKVTAPPQHMLPSDLTLDGEATGEGDNAMPANIPQLDSPFLPTTCNRTPWRSEGTGLSRLEREGIEGQAGAWVAKPPQSGKTHLSVKEAGSGVEGRSIGQDLLLRSEEKEDEHERTSRGRSWSLTKESEEPTGLKFGETIQQRTRRVKTTSPYGHLPGYRLDGLIAKSNDDVRQEVFVMQMIAYLKLAFATSNVPVWIHTYRILSTSQTTGLIQLIPNASSLDGIKKSQNFPGTLRLFFEQSFAGESGVTENPNFHRAISNYIASLAGYSVVSYVLAIKDRHNGNIMLDTEGHIIHIDFGFVFGLAPGKAFSMERAPFKLNEEMTNVMGGRFSPHFAQYVQLVKDAFLAARRHADTLCSLMEIMMFKSNYPAFRYNPNAIQDMRGRLMVDLSDSEVPAAVDQLIARSYKHSGTDLYDQFQLATNGISP